MNITTPRKDLLAAATRAASVADRKSTMPILGTVLLTPTDNGLRVSASDLYLSLVEDIDAEASGSAIAVDAHDLAARLKMMPDGPVDLARKDGNLTLKAKGSARRYTMRLIDGADFPPIPTPADDAPRITLPAKILTRLIAVTKHSISTDETRAHMNSLKLELESGLARAVSTDGHRLTKLELKVDGGAAADLLIPLKAVVELGKIAEGEEGDLTLIPRGSTLFTQSERSTFSVKLVDAAFPPYAQVIPTATQHTIGVPRVALLDAIKAVAIAASEKTGGVRLAFDAGVVRITSESPDGGDGADEVPCEVRAGSGKAIVGVNGKYLTDALGVLATDEVLLGISGEIDPITIRTSDADGYVAVVMPMRI